MSRIYAKQRSTKFLCDLKRIPTQAKRAYEKTSRDEFFYEKLSQSKELSTLDAVSKSGLCKVQHRSVFYEHGLSPVKGETSDPGQIAQICVIHGMEKYEIDMLIQNGGIFWK